MKHNNLFWIGIGLGLIGLWIVMQAASPRQAKKLVVQEGYCEVSYPSDWHTEVRKAVMELSESGEPPTISVYNPNELRTRDSMLAVTADIQNPEKTILMRLVFIESTEPVDLMQLAKMQSTINNKQPDYNLTDLKEITINSLTAVRKIETYRVDTNQGPVRHSVVATYFKVAHGMCSVLLIEPPWSEMQAQMQVYEEIVNSFQTGK